MRVRLFEINAAVRLSDEWRLFEQDNTFFYSFSFSFCKQKFQIGFIAKIHFPLWMKYWHFFFFFKFTGSRLMWKKKMLWKSKRICFSYEEGYRFYVLDVCLWLLGGKIIITSDNAVIKVATMAWTQKPSLKAKGNGRRGAPLHCFSKFMCCVKHSG